MHIGLVHHPIFQEHDPGRFHVETPSRLRVLDQAMRGWPGLRNCQRLPLRPAEEAELRRVHHPSHLQRVAATEGKHTALDQDTATSPKSYEASLLATGSLIDLCDRVLMGVNYNGMAMVRPPGHHATPDRAMGFCLFNNVSVAAAHLVERRKLERVLIVDWDVHHGNGTEDIFYSDDRVLYFSTHQSPMYPGSGPVSAVGSGSGKGRTVNVPMNAGRGDMEYIRVFQDILVPVARQFKPQFILVSAGFDAHHEDPLGGMRITSQGFAALTQILMGLSIEFCYGKLVMTLEGGYAVSALARSIISCLDILCGDRQDELIAQAKEAEPPKAVERVKEVQKSYWEFD